MQKLSAPEKHFLVLMCSDASRVDWSHGLERLIASRRGKQVSYLDQSKHQLLEDGQLSIKDLEESDAGEYYCNHQLVADIRVLKGILVFPNSHNCISSVGMHTATTGCQDPKKQHESKIKVVNVNHATYFKSASNLYASIYFLLTLCVCS